MDPFLSDRRARWHPVDTLCFPYVATSPPPASLHHHEIPSTSPGALRPRFAPRSRTWTTPPARRAPPEEFCFWFGYFWISGKSELPHAVIMIGTTREKPVKLRTRTGESISAMQLSLKKTMGEEKEDADDEDERPLIGM